VQGIHAHRLVDLGDLLGLLDAEGLVSGKTHLDGVHEYLHGEVLAATPLDLLDHVDDEAGTVLHALRPVLVVALVPETRQEAVEQMVGRGVDLDAVPAGRLQAGGAGREAVDQLLDLVDGKRVGWFFIVHVERRRVSHGRSGAGLGDEGVDAAPRTAVVQLREDGAAVLMHFG